MNLKDVEIFWIEASDDALDTAAEEFLKWIKSRFK